MKQPLFNKDPKISNWKVIATTNDLKSQDNSTQHIRNLDYVYVYCYPYWIIINNAKYNCSTRTMKLASNIGWSTHDVTYEASIISRTGIERIFTDDVSAGHFVHLSNDTDYNSVIQIIAGLRAKIEIAEAMQNSGIHVENSAGVWLTILGLISILAGIAVLIILNFKVTVRSHAMTNNVRRDIDDMRTEAHYSALRSPSMCSIVETPNQAISMMNLEHKLEDNLNRRETAPSIISTMRTIDTNARRQSVAPPPPPPPPSTSGSNTGSIKQRASALNLHLIS